jgi:hypothetical protein
MSVQMHLQAQPQLQTNKLLLPQLLLQLRLRGAAAASKQLAAAASKQLAAAANSLCRLRRC